jgi:hypothetical protein
MHVRERREAAGEGASTSTSHRRMDGGNSGQPEAMDV